MGGQGKAAPTGRAARFSSRSRLQGARAAAQERQQQGDRRKRLYVTRAEKIVAEIGQEPLKGGVTFPTENKSFGGYDELSDTIVLSPRWVDDSDDYTGFEPQSAFFRGMILHELGHRAELAEAPRGWQALLLVWLWPWRVLVPTYAVAAALPVIALYAGGVREVVPLAMTWCVLLLALLLNAAVRKREVEYRADRFAARLDQKAVEAMLGRLVRHEREQRREFPVRSVLNVLRGRTTHPPTPRRLRRIRKFGAGNTRPDGGRSR